MQVTAGVYWDELEAANVSEEFRAQQQDFVQLSFTTISAFGSNGAIIHYMPTPETNIPLDTTSLYLIDSGAQFMGKRIKTVKRIERRLLIRT